MASRVRGCSTRKRTRRCSLAARWRVMWTEGRRLLLVGLVMKGVASRATAAAHKSRPIRPPPCTKGYPPGPGCGPSRPRGALPRCIPGPALQGSITVDSSDCRLSDDLSEFLKESDPATDYQSR